MIPDQVIYIGSITHTRLIPKRHFFRYNFFSLFLDIDQLEETQKRLKIFSVNKFNLISFYNRDHGPRDGSSLRPWLDSQFKRRNLPAADKIFLLSFPRIFGYVFNPFSAYFCYSKNNLLAIGYEVKNTFGDQILYIRTANISDKSYVTHKQEKQLHVSPFIEMDQTYEFVLNPPGDKLNIKISQSGLEGKTLVATQTGKAIELNNGNLLSCFFRYPLMTFKVIIGIHFEALILLLKGIKIYRYINNIKKE